MKNEPEWPPELKELEEQLQSIEPAPLDDSFRRHLLARRPDRSVRLGLWLSAAAALLCAATVLWVLTRAEPAHQRVVEPRPVDRRPGPPATALPTWLAYTRAASESPEALDRLLTDHNRQLLQNVPSLEKSIPL